MFWTISHRESRVPAEQIASTPRSPVMSTPFAEDVYGGEERPGRTQPG
ncbi:hypothetical protein [Streptomyces lateritius]